MSDSTSKKPRVLIVDDDVENLTIFRSVFRRELEITTASSATEALAHIDAAESPFPLIITDQRMPEMTGVQLLAHARERSPDSIRMILTAYTDIEAVIDAVNIGNVYKFIYKPWEKEELQNTILNALETFNLRARNQALTEELLRTERMATIGKLLSGLGHEIGNQLCMAVISENLLSRYRNDEFLSQQLQIIKSSLSMISGMVREIRDFSLAKNTELELDTRPIQPIVEETLKLLRYDHDVKKVALETELQPTLEALVHRDKIQQVIINLIKNAAQAIPEDRKGRVRVELRGEPDRTVIRISDNGSGIPPEIQARIWEPFFTTKAGAGTGLGLDICRQIVEAHGGTIHCRSTPGEGTLFEVALPARRTAEPPAVPA